MLKNLGEKNLEVYHVLLNNLHVSLLCPLPFSGTAEEEEEEEEEEEDDEISVTKLMSYAWQISVGMVSLSLCNLHVLCVADKRWYGESLPL